MELKKRVKIIIKLYYLSKCLRERERERDKIIPQLLSGRTNA
jgi:hypothetical protein